MWQGGQMVPSASLVVQRSGVGVAVTVIPSTVGTLVAAVAGRDLVSVGIATDPDAAAAQMIAEIIAELTTWYPAAAIIRDDVANPAIADALVAITTGQQPAVWPEVDLHGTPFQIRVWNELRRIPCGEVRSYAEVAGAIGSPTAVRAVAGACAANPVGLVVPCHRVIRSDGSLGGFGWGVETKRRLLEAEGVAVAHMPTTPVRAVR